jgi:hypothetical protein
VGWESAGSESYDEGVFVLGEVHVESSNVSIHLLSPSSVFASQLGEMGCAYRFV